MSLPPLDCCGLQITSSSVEQKKALWSDSTMNYRQKRYSTPFLFLGTRSHYLLVILGVHNRYDSPRRSSLNFLVNTLGALYYHLPEKQYRYPGNSLRASPKTYCKHSSNTSRKLVQHVARPTENTSQKPPKHSAKTTGNTMRGSTETQYEKPPKQSTVTPGNMLQETS